MRLIVVAFAVIAPILLACSNHSNASRQYEVGGDLRWTIPPSNDYYNKWSSEQSFHAGDSLVFEFESEFHDVIQVSRSEYENCSAESPFQAFHGPAIVPLDRQATVYCFICSQHCVVGQKLCVITTAGALRSDNAHSSWPSMAPSLPPGDGPSLPPAVLSSGVDVDISSSELDLSENRSMVASRRIALLILCVVVLVVLV
ncbi:hypothetical protein Syun_008089 [Stephania yunnanensis]|uniref:Phytocyanin domain-containing protein n=1 Tax=Stephania yunnanensis TaxID=152371 RepID=A0AAP0L138_9MAGN